jgi:hypothetical protein
MALGMLTKGPVAIVIPLLASFLFFLSQGAWRRWLTAAFNPLGWLIFLTLTLPWYIAAYLQEGQAFIDGFFLTQNIGRFTSNIQGHGGSVFYYFLILPLVLLPYTGWFARVLSRIRQSRIDPEDQLLWLWFGVVFIFFSLSKTQLPHYIVYGITPLFLLMAKHTEQLRSRWLAYSLPLVIQATLLFLPEIVAYAAHAVTVPYQQQMLARGSDVFDPPYRITAAAMLVLVASMICLRRVSPARGLLVIGLAQTWFVAQSLLPAAAALQQAPVHQAALVARELETTVVMWGFNMPSFSVYRGAVTPHRAPVAGEVVFTHVGRLAHLHKYELLYQQGGIVLAKVIEP